MRRAGLLAALLVAPIVGWAHFPTRALPKDVVADRIVVEKSKHTLTLYTGTTAKKQYVIAIGNRRDGNKQAEGDRRTPEGKYVIDRLNANSKYHRALHISYPNSADRARMSRPGGDIEIHGVPDSLAWLGRFSVIIDWTAGCIVLKNSDVDELWRAVPVGTRIEILP